MPNVTSPRRWAVALTAVGAFVAFLDVTIVNIAFPDLYRSFPGASIAHLSWVLNAYNIAFAALLIVAGRLADVLGPQADVPRRPRRLHPGLRPVRGRDVATGS